MIGIDIAVCSLLCLLVYATVYQLLFPTLWEILYFFSFKLFWGRYLLFADRICHRNCL